MRDVRTIAGLLLVVFLLATLGACTPRMDPQQARGDYITCASGATILYDGPGHEADHGSSGLTFYDSTGRRRWSNADCVVQY